MFKSLIRGTVVAVVATASHAAEVNVAVAANFTAPMQQIAKQFAQDTGHQAKLSFGATGAFYAQIKNGAPFQVLLSADDATPKKLEAEGLIAPGTRFTYAIGQLVLWSAQPGLVDNQGAVLSNPAIQRVAIANPKLAPYGAAAQETLTRMKLWDAIQAKLVQGDNIGQTHQFVATGNAQVGFVALSQVMRDGRVEKGSVWVVPATHHAPIRQDAVLLKSGEGNAAAAALLAYLKGDKARAVIRSFGYALADK